MVAKTNRSPLWNCFERVGDDKSKCSICNALISIKSGSITNMYKHLYRKHTEYANEHYKNRVDKSLPKYPKTKRNNDTKIVENIYVNADGYQCDDIEYEVTDPASIASNSMKIDIEENNSLDEVVYLQCIPTKQEKSTSQTKTKKMFEVGEQTAVKNNGLKKKICICNNMQCEDDNDEMGYFFKSMAMCVKKLPPSLIAKAKMEICNIVGKLELRHLKNLEKCNNSEMTQTDDYSISEVTQTDMND